jgi:hypothetical protein
MRGNVLSALAILSCAATARAQAPSSPPPPPPATSALSLIATIALPGVTNKIGANKFDKLAGDGARLFVSAKMNNSVAVVDLASAAFVAAIEGLEEPQGVELLAPLGLVLVATAGDGLLHGFSTSPPFAAAWPAVSVGLDADNVKCEAVDAAAGTALCWVAHGGGGGAPGGMAFVRVGAAAAEWLGDAPFPAHPEEMQLAPASLSSLMYVSAPDDDSKVLVFDRATRQIVLEWPLLVRAGASQPFANALDAAGLRLFVAAQANDGLSAPQFLVLNLLDGSVVWRMDTTAVCDNIVYDAAARLIYVACGGVTGSVGSVLYVVQQGADASTYALLGAAAGTPPGLAIARTCFFDATSGLLYLSVPQNDDVAPPQQAAVLVFQRNAPVVPPGGGGGGGAAAGACPEGSLPASTVGGLSVGVAVVAVAIGVRMGRSALCGAAAAAHKGGDAGGDYSLA